METLRSDHEKDGLFHNSKPQTPRMERKELEEPPLPRLVLLLLPEAHKALARLGEEGGTLSLTGDEALHLPMTRAHLPNRFVEAAQHALHHVLLVARHSDHRHAHALRLRQNPLELAHELVVGGGTVDSARGVLWHHGGQRVDHHHARCELLADSEHVVQRHVRVAATLHRQVVAVHGEARHVECLQRVVEKRRLARADVAFEENGAAGLEVRGRKRVDEWNGLLAVALRAETLVLVVVLVPREEISQLPTGSRVWLSTERNGAEESGRGS